MTSATSAASAGMLTAEVTTPPVRAAATCSATTTPARSWASEVEAPRCGVTTTPGSPKSGLSVTGSSGKTSMAAPARWPLPRASRRASWSTTSPRAALMRRAPGFMAANASRPTKPRVSSVDARCRVMKSLTR